jgi:predicted SAM-dependent methyltransferase
LVEDEVMGSPDERSPVKQMRSNSRARNAKRVIIGSGGIAYPGWMATDKDTLDVRDRSGFLQYGDPGSFGAFIAEHVWEHLSQEEVADATANCFHFLKPGGRLRIAVPDGFHPDPAYIESVRPGGSGAGADDHKVLYSYRSLKRELEKQGFLVHLLEYWDEQGEFHYNEWSSEDGHILRSKRYDPRNQDGSLSYTSLIVDAVTPSLLRQLAARLLAFLTGGVRCG